jgi:hypothetical protein
MNAMNVVFFGPDPTSATIRARGMLLGNLLVLTQSNNIVKFKISVESAREQFRRMIGSPVPISFKLKTLDRGDIIFDSEGYLELGAVFAVMIVELDLSPEDLEMYKPE